MGYSTSTDKQVTLHSDSSSDSESCFRRRLDVVVDPWRFRCLLGIQIADGLNPDDDVPRATFVLDFLERSIVR